MFGIGITELLVVLAVVILIFGTKKLGTFGSDLGAAIKGFRSALSTEPENKAPSAAESAKVIDGEAERKK